MSAAAIIVNNQELDIMEARYITERAGRQLVEKETQASEDLARRRLISRLDRDRRADIVRERREAKRLDRETPVSEVLDNYANLSRVEVREKVLSARGKFEQMIVIGAYLQKMKPGGWCAQDFTSIVVFIFGKSNIWHSNRNTVTHDDEASVRSLLYEMSPSSCQHWFKFGKVALTGLVNPICFVNKQLADVNADAGWAKVSGAGTGRNTIDVRNHWHFVPTLDKENWNTAAHGALPSENVLNMAHVCRVAGDRAY
jgi:hypothetical protein